MNTGKRNTVFVIIALIFIASSIMGADPEIHCNKEKGCNIYNQEGKICKDCLVQVIKTGSDGKIDFPYGNKSASGDDKHLLDADNNPIIKYTNAEGKVNQGDFFLKLSSHRFQEEKEFYFRIWDSNNLSSSDYFGESKILSFDNLNKSYDLKENISLNKKPGFYVKSRNRTFRIKNVNKDYTISPENNDGILDSFYVKIRNITENITYNISIKNNEDEFVLDSEEKVNEINFSWRGKFNQEYLGEGKYSVFLEIEKNNDNYVKKDMVNLGTIKIDNTPSNFNISESEVNLTEKNPFRFNLSFSEDTHFWKILDKTGNRSNLNISWKYNQSLGKSIIDIGEFYENSSMFLTKPSSIGYDFLEQQENRTTTMTNKSGKVKNNLLFKETPENYNLTIRAFDKAGNKKQKNILIKREDLSNLSTQNKSKIIVRYLRDTTSSIVVFNFSNNTFDISDPESGLGLKINMENKIDKGNINITEHTEIPDEDIEEPEEKEDIGKFFSISVGDKISGNMEKATLETSYSDKLVEDVDEESLQFYYYNSSLEKWEGLGTEIDLEDNKIVGETEHFSLFGVFGEEKEEEDDNDNSNEDDEESEGNEGSSEGNLREEENLENKKNNSEIEKSEKISLNARNAEESTSLNEINKETIPGFTGNVIAEKVIQNKGLSIIIIFSVIILATLFLTIKIRK